MKIFLAKTGSSVTFVITGDDGKLGELEVGQGSVIWRGKSQRKGKRIRWNRFAKHLEEM